MAMPETPFLEHARRIRTAVGVPVIAVGRLGDPVRAMAAVDEGRADFVALGRPLLADPDWPENVRAGRAVRRCIACNSCVDGMRGGGALHCYVNAAAGRERAFGGAGRPEGERIAVIGAGPAGLTYASLVAENNRVTLFERRNIAGGALRLAARAPWFQGVEAAPGPIDAYLSALEEMCRQAGVKVRLGLDVRRAPDRLEPFDRLVIATGAEYRYGLGWGVRGVIASGAARHEPIRRLFTSKRIKDWFYRSARRASGDRFVTLARPHQSVVVIGDARVAATGEHAIRDAFEAACAGPRRAEGRAGTGGVSTRA